LKLDLKFQTAFRLEINGVLELGMIARSNESYCLKTFMESVPRVKFQHDRSFIKDIRHYFYSPLLYSEPVFKLNPQGKGITWEELKESFDSDKTEED